MLALNGMTVIVSYVHQILNFQFLTHQHIGWVVNTAWIYYRYYSIMVTLHEYNEDVDCQAFMLSPAELNFSLFTAIVSSLRF